LERERGARHPLNLPQLSIDQVLKWADAYRELHGRWPNARSGAIEGSNDETWGLVDSALRNGHRGIKSGGSLSQLLHKRRNVHSARLAPKLTIPKILRWVDAYYRANHKWPTARHNLIPDSGGETWARVDSAMKEGLRGLSGGTTLARLLGKERGVRNRKNLPRLSVKKILACADTYYKRHGRWPGMSKTEIPGSQHETWLSVDHGLRAGNRGLSGRSSLARLLAAHRGKRNPTALPRLQVPKIFKWMESYFKRWKLWPTKRSGLVAEASGDTWSALDYALMAGGRGLEGGLSLAKLRKRYLE
jgi:hypothetical protein